MTYYKIEQYRSLVRTAPPATEPVTLAEAKDHLRVDHTEDDAYIATLIQAAREFVEASIDRTLITTPWKMTFDGFPPEIVLARPPASRSVTATVVTYLDADRNTVTLPESDYRVDRDATPAVIRNLYGRSWPPHLTDQNSVTVQWSAGYGDSPDDVPRTVRHAMLMIVGHLYERRLAYDPLAANEVPLGVKALLAASSWGAYQ